LISESSNNKVYNNTIEGVTDEAVLLFNPPVPDDGMTTKNLVYQNIISNSDDGIRLTLTHDNILENNTFHNITSNEYLSENSSMIIRGQIFDDTLITEAGTAPGNLVEIVDSGTIHVVELDERESQGNNTNYNGNIEDHGGNGDVIVDIVDGGAPENIKNNNNNNEEGDSFNTNIKPFTIRISQNQSISVNS
jgi:parallel beta-helix repeat protein